MTIEQFMWGFQPHFRNGIERVARSVFGQIGFGLGARAFLVGFTDDLDSPAYAWSLAQGAALTLDDLVLQALDEPRAKRGQRTSSLTDDLPSLTRSRWSTSNCSLS